MREIPKNPYKANIKSGKMNFILKFMIIAIISITFVSNHILFSHDQQINENIVNFNSEAALNKSQQIVYEYFKDYSGSVSRYVGKVWLESISKQQNIRDITVFEDYLNELQRKNLKNIRMDCTIYAEECLRAGFKKDTFNLLKKYHNEIWQGKGFAGWSVAYLLTNEFGWKAYAFINPGAINYNHYTTHFINGEYPVWMQPNTQIIGYFILGEDNEKIESLLSEQEFGWGFSEDGVHTLITNFTDLKECHWDGPPAEKYNRNNSFPVLFETTRFVEFEDYDVHLVVFPPGN